MLTHRVVIHPANPTQAVPIPDRYGAVYEIGGGQIWITVAIKIANNDRLRV